MTEMFARAADPKGVSRHEERADRIGDDPSPGGGAGAPAPFGVLVSVGLIINLRSRRGTVRDPLTNAPTPNARLQAGITHRRASGTSLGADPDDLLCDVSKPRLRGGHDARTVLVCLFVAHDRADIAGVGELLDCRDRVRDRQLVVVRNR